MEFWALQEKQGQIADKVNRTFQTDKNFACYVRTNQMGQNFDPPFLKGGAVEAAEASSPSAEGDQRPKRRFFLRTFSLRLMHAKKKWGDKFVVLNELSLFNRVF